MPKQMAQTQNKNGLKGFSEFLEFLAEEVSNLIHRVG
jgi:hypothetical protein